MSAIKYFAIPPSFDYKNVNHCLAFGLGSGLFKHAPGTWGSAAAVLIYMLLLAHSHWLLWASIILGFIVGIYICGTTAEDLGVHDHGGIVWDEFVGQWITLAFLPVVTFESVGFSDLCYAFLLFRIFDIVKPWPIRWLDKNIEGGLGIMLDDVLAGTMAGIILCLSYYFSPINPYI